MFTTTIDDLYAAVEVRGGLTKRVRFEEFVSEMRAIAGTAAQPVFIEDEEDPETIPFAKTLPSQNGQDGTIPCAVSL